MILYCFDLNLTTANSTLYHHSSCAEPIRGVANIPTSRNQTFANIHMYLTSIFIVVSHKCN